MQRLTFLLIFFLSSMAVLVHQVVWAHQATLMFGVSMYSYSVVTVAFMAGAALGSQWLGKRADHMRSPLLVYAGLQVGIALLGGLVPFAFSKLLPFYGIATQWFALGSVWMQVTRAYFALLLCAPPAFLMGATLPVLARACTRRTAQVGSAVGALYAAGALGATFGCGLAGLFLLRLLGTAQTGYLASSLDMLAALGAVWYGYRERSAPATSPATAAETASTLPAAPTASPKRLKIRATLSKDQNTLHETSPAVAAQPADMPALPFYMRTVVLITYALSGFIALGYVMAWARLLVIFTANANFARSLMLTTFLAGLTLGSGFCTWWLQRHRATLTQLANGQIAIGLTALLTLFLFAFVPNPLANALTTEAGSATQLMRYGLLLGCLTFLLPAALLGALFPLVTSLYTGETANAVGQQVGRLYAFSLVGALLGIFINGFVALPLIGLQATVATLSVLNLIIGVVLSWLPLMHSLQSRLVPQGGLALGIALILLLPPGHYVGLRTDANQELKYYGEGAEATVAVFAGAEQNGKVSYVNGRSEGLTTPTTLHAFRLLGHLPALLRPEAQQALMINFGNGMTTGALDTHNILRIDAIDLAAEQFKAAALYWQENYNVLNSPRVHKFVEDGRNFLLQTPDAYDIITTGATDPVNGGSWALFTQEFYHVVATHLAPSGVFMQSLPFDQLSETDYRAIIRTFQSVFPNTTLWYTGDNQTFLVATPYALTKDKLLTLLGTPGAGDSVVGVDLGAPAVIASYLVMDADAVRAYGRTGAFVTDNDAFFLPNHEDRQQIAQMYQTLQQKQ